MVRHRLLLTVPVLCLCAAVVWVWKPAATARRGHGRPATLLTEEDALVLRWAAAVRRGDRGDAARIEAECVRRGDAVVEPLAHIADESPEIAGEVVCALGCIRCQASSAAIERICRAHARAGEASVRTAAFRALAELGGEGARSSFLRLLRDESDPDVRRVAAELAPALLRPEELSSLPPDLLALVQGDVANRAALGKLLTELSETPASSRPSADWAQYLSGAWPAAVRSLAVDRLEARADAEALDALRGTAAADDLDAALIAFAGLCRMRGHEARGIVRDLVLAAAGSRLEAMLDVLGTFGDAAYVPLVRQIEQGSGSEGLKALAHRAALRLGMRR